MLDEKNLSPMKYKKVNEKTGHEVLDTSEVAEELIKGMSANWNPREEKGNAGTLVDLMPLLWKSFEAKGKSKSMSDDDEEETVSTKKKSAKKISRRKAG